MPPRNFQSGLSKKPTRENRRANDFLSLPSTSGNNTIGRQHDEGNVSFNVLGFRFELHDICIHFLNDRITFQETAATPVKVACPICGRAFLTDQIEVSHFKIKCKTSYYHLSISNNFHFCILLFLYVYGPKAEGSIILKLVYFTLSLSC